MTIFYTSDLHIGHRLVAGTRGFLVNQPADFGLPGAGSSEALRDFYRDNADTDSHDAALAAYWDRTVKSNDTVYVLGDTGLGRFENYVLPWFDARPGTKHLIAGNHDPVHPTRSDAVKLQKRWLQTFDTINPYATRKIAGYKVMLSHFPYESFADGTDPEHGEEGGRWNEWRVPESLGKLLLHGHTHGQERAHGKSLHVGWDAWGRFVTQDEVIEWVESLHGDGSEPAS